MTRWRVTFGFELLFVIGRTNNFLLYRFHAPLKEGYSVTVCGNVGPYFINLTCWTFWKICSIHIYMCMYSMYTMLSAIQFKHPDTMIMQLVYIHNDFHGIRMESQYGSDIIKQVYMQLRKIWMMEKVSPRSQVIILTKWTPVMLGVQCIHWVLQSYFIWIVNCSTKWSIVRMILLLQWRQIQYYCW